MFKAGRFTNVNYISDHSNSFSSSRMISRSGSAPSLHSSGSGLWRSLRGCVRSGIRNSAGRSGPARPSTASAGTMKLRQICAGTVPPLTLPERLVVVSPDPHADDQIAGEADERARRDCPGWFRSCRTSAPPARRAGPCRCSPPRRAGRASAPSRAASRCCPPRLEQAREAARRFLLRAGRARGSDSGRWRRRHKRRSARAG